MFRPIRLMLLALLLAVIPASSYAGVFISVGFAPPVLPVYVQPPCPEPGWMWTPGYWAYGADGYYWVPGTWVPAPYVGALWTPGYWGWGSGLYVWHPGYWGPHVGYYGGVNYGFGYMGVGFAGGLWVGGAFRYNTAVMHVGPGIRNVYVDNTIVHNTTIVNNTHVAYSGGPGGINHPPTAQENTYSHEAHQSATSYQTQHQTAAMHNNRTPRRIVFGRLPAPQIRTRPIVRIGPHDQQIARLPLVAVRHPGRHHHHIPGPHRQHFSARATEQHGRLAPGDAQDLMRGAVEMVERMHPVPPRRRPAVGREQPLDPGCVRRHRIAINQQRQAANSGSPRHRRM